MTISALVLLRAAAGLLALALVAVAIRLYRSARELGVYRRGSVADPEMERLSDWSEEISAHVEYWR